MKTLERMLQQRTSEAVQKSFPQLSSEESQAEVVKCLHEQFGHYQCNSALKLAPILKENPRKIAERIVAHINLQSDEGDTIVEKTEVAGAGFINFLIDPYFLSRELERMIKDPTFKREKVKKPMKIIIEFSSPNVAKELHVGHLRSTIIGDALANLFEFFGHRVLRINHIGDWGTQFGMLIAYLKTYQPEVLKKEKATLSQLTGWYKKSKKIFDQELDFRSQARQEVVKLQSQDRENIRIWKLICMISRSAFEEIYDLLDVHLIERGESFYNPFLPEIIKDLEKKGIITISEGAKCVFLDGYMNREGKPLPIILQKSDGGYNYDTTELAAFRHRIQEEKADWIMNVVDAGQSLHFEMIEQLAIKASYLDPKKTRFDHVSFGVVLGPDGKKFKTREGETEKLIDLLEGAIKHAKKILIERKVSTDEEELNRFAKILGIGAVKYADLSTHREKDYVFSYEKMLNLEGNTAAFLLYSFVRVMGIKRNVQVDLHELILTAIIHLQHPTEISLGLHLRRFSEALEMMGRDLLPNRLADYLYELAEKFNAFFRDCRVIGSKEQNSRLLLCELTGRILEQGLKILGIRTLPRM